MSDRFHNAPSESGELRRPAERDYDRVVYSSAFRRLSGVTQVASAVEGEVIHHRMIHSLKVGQISRRLAEYLQRKHNIGSDVVDADVAETAGLAHDLGHPPFGHIGEETLNRCLRDADEEGYEGNAQSFRIVTRLNIRARKQRGLNLTRRTLNAILKYPRLQEDPVLSKWGAYADDAEVFHWAREGAVAGRRSIEADIMDWADDITYAIHDVDDFYRAGLIPLHLLAISEEERERFLVTTGERWKVRNPNLPNEIDQYKSIFHELIALLGVGGPSGLSRYSGNRDDQAFLKEIASFLIARYINAASVRQYEDGRPRLIIDEEQKKEIKIIKELNWHYVVESAALKTQQHGYAHLIEHLFNVYKQDSSLPLVPAWVKAEIDFESKPGRRAADIIACLTDAQVSQIHSRLFGYRSGSVRDWV